MGTPYTYSQLSTIMKVVIVLLALVSVTLAQHANQALNALIHHEIDALQAADPNLTDVDCTNKCDALFDLVDPHDEQITDEACKNICEHRGVPHSTHPTHHPHPTFPTHHPHIFQTQPTRQ